MLYLTQSFSHDIGKLKMCRSLRRKLSQSNSQVVAAILLYSASVDDLLTVACFFVFQETSECPKKIQYPVKDLLVIKYEAQSASENPVIFR
ncbi:hypothetical protein Tco_1525793 [Tanacetum coccineum]